MISKSAIENECGPRILRRAKSIAEGGRMVYDRRVRYDGEFSQINAQVASQTSTSQAYRVSLVVNEEADEIEDYSCTCPAAWQFDGMCKHAAALALDFNERGDQYVGFRRDRAAASSDCVTAFMQRAESQHRDETPDESVGLHCELTVEYGQWSLSLRVVGAEASYVVKSISDFCKRVEEGAYFAYGKKLAFAHVSSRFTEEARSIVRFVCQVTQTRRPQVASSYWRYAQAAPGRSLSLSDSEAAELLCLLDGADFSIKGADGLAGDVAHAHIEHSDPNVALALRQSSRGGFTIERDERIWVIGQGSRMFVWTGGASMHRCSDDFAKSGDFLRSVYASDETRPFIAERDMPLFCATALPLIEKRLQLDLPPEAEAYKPVACKLGFFFDRDKTKVSLRVQVSYAQRTFDILGELGNHTEAPTDAPRPVRDVKAEGRALSLASRYFGDGYTLPFSQEEAVASLLFGGLAEFRVLGDVFTTPAFDRLIRDDKPRVTMGVSLSGNLLNLNIDAGDLPAGELSSLLSSYRLRKRYHRLRSGAFIDLQEANFDQLERIASDLGLTSRQLASGNIELPAYRAFYLNEEADLERDRSFMQYIDNFKAVNEADYALPENLQDVLRPYQEEGFRWLSARCDAGFGAVLADEMGLGKSLQLISLLLARREEVAAVAPSLIVCPASLVYNWTAEFERFAPELRVVAVAGAAQERKIAREAAFARDSRADVVVTSYDLLRIDVKQWTKHELYACVLDEAQYIKNPAALTTRAAKSLVARHKIALTGTPMENRLSELWSIFDFLMPGLLGSYARFREHFELSIVGGDDEVAARLQALVGPFMLRRLKADVLVDLPDKLEGTVFAHMDAEQRKLYDAHEQNLREQLTLQRQQRKQRAADRAAGKPVSTVEVLAEITRLRQLCCDPRLVYEDYRGSSAKLDAIVELVSSAVESGEKTLVFSQFTSFLELIAERLRAEGVEFYRITGATPKKQRVELVDAFNGDEVPVFLVSLKAGGTGLNLTGASVVIHADPWWNAAAQSQATDRAHRIGQTRVVNVQKVVAKDTIEERIVKLQETKSELAEQVIGSGGVSLSSLDADDLLELLEG